MMIILHLAAIIFPILAKHKPEIPADFVSREGQFILSYFEEALSRRVLLTFMAQNNTKEWERQGKKNGKILNSKL